MYVCVYVHMGECAHTFVCVYVHICECAHTLSQYEQWNFCFSTIDCIITLLKD